MSRLIEQLQLVLLAAVVAAGVSTCIYFLSKYTAEVNIEFYRNRTEMYQHEVELKKKILEELHVPPEYINTDAIGR